MKYFTLSTLILSVVIWGCSSAPPKKEERNGWVPNNNLKFHLGYYSKDEAKGKVVSPSIDYGNEDNADITNINLKSFLDLGFPVTRKRNSKSYNFFLKFYEYPKSISHHKSVKRIVSAFYLKELGGYDSIEKLVMSRDNVLVKKGLIRKSKTTFSSKNPYSPLRVSDIDGQRIFDKGVVFSSLYVKPVSSRKSFESDTDYVDFSNNGVEAFHNEIKQVYNTKLQFLGEDKDDLYFLDSSSCQQPKCLVGFIKLPKKAMYFEKIYKNLPMPQDPKSIFLSGLLLIYRDIYSVDSADVNKINKNNFKTIGKRIDSHVLEIGSVANFNDSVVIKSLKIETISAIKGNDINSLEKLLNQRVDVNQRDKNGSSLLMIAAGLGHYEVSKVLVENGSDIHQVDSKMGVTALHRASQSGNIKIVKMLLDKGAFIDGQSFVNGHTPLLDAAFYKRYDAIELLLKNGSNLKLRNTLGLTVMDWGRRQKDKKITGLVEEQIKRDKILEKEQKLMAAVKANNVRLVRKLIARGSDVNQVAKDGNTPLLWVSKYGYSDIAKLLLENGANPNIVDRLMKATPGHKAAFFGHTEITKMLIKHGLTLDAIGPYNGYTALHDAILNSHLETSRALINAGARVDIPGVDGKTSIALAKELDLKDLLKLMNERKK